MVYMKTCRFTPFLLLVNTKIWWAQLTEANEETDGRQGRKVRDRPIVLRETIVNKTYGKHKNL